MHFSPHRHKMILLIFLYAACSHFSFAQFHSPDEIVYQQDSLHRRFPREKIFLHTDKQVYSTEDTVWLKGYILSGPSLIANDSSRLVYLELIGSRNELLKRISIPCQYGLFAADLPLHGNVSGRGLVRLRAYTLYAAAFGDSLFFDRSIAITDTRKNTPAAKGQSLGNTVPADSRTLNKTSQTFQNDPPGEIDLQFLPEGGIWIAGLEQRLGFKAVNSSGKGIDIKGVIKDATGQVILPFASLHKGMGILSFTPKANAVYTAVLDNGMSFRLPEVQLSGISLQVRGDKDPDSLILRITSSPDLYGQRISFTGSTGGIAVARGSLQLPAQGFQLMISKMQLLPGVTEFTVYDAHLMPVCGRAVFIGHQQDIQLQLHFANNVAGCNDSILISLQAQNSSGSGVTGSFSVAVIDTSQLPFTPGTENLKSYMLLSSDLKGEIEDPAYYVDQPDPAALEALMLTQGWVSYRQMSFSTVPSYEKDYRIRGKVTDVFNKPVSNAKITLFAKTGRSSQFIMDTTANNRGEFTFMNFPLFETDSMHMLFSARNKKGKAFNTGVQIDEPVFPAIHSKYGPAPEWSVLNDSLIPVTERLQQAVRSRYMKDSTTMGEVIVHARTRIPGSHNLNEDGASDQVIGKKDLEEKPKGTLLSVLEEKVPGFGIGNFPKSTIPVYKIHSNIVRLVIDGVDMQFFYLASNNTWDEYLQFVRTTLQSFTAEEVRAIEIMNSGTNETYRNALLSPRVKVSTGPATFDFSFIEITTQTGMGPFQHTQPGMYLYRPVYPVVSRQFYTPKYVAGNALPDPALIRSTVYWNPDVVTDAAGKANFSFFAPCRPGNFLIIVQGTDMNGRFGILYRSLPIKK